MYNNPRAQIHKNELNPVSSLPVKFEKACADWFSFSGRIGRAFSEATLAALQDYSGPSWQADSERQVLATARRVFDSQFRNTEFLYSLSAWLDSYCAFAKEMGVGQYYQNLSALTAFCNNLFLEPLRDELFRSHSHRIYSDKNFSLVHYDGGPPTGDGKATPLLVVYAFINRHYILDLLPHVSVIGNLLRQGLDIYATDWSSPGPSDRDLSMGDYVNSYLDSSVDTILKHGNADKVSILGYCWGGDLALMYASLHPDKVRTISTLATPGDFSRDNGLLSLWTKSINADSIVSTFGNAPSAFINSAFLLRSPLDFLHKYPHFFERPRDLQSILEFLATEIWLYDSPPVAGGVYRQFVNDCYRDNLLIQDRMEIGQGQRIELKNVVMPYLNIVASKDDLVAPASSKALNKAVGSSVSELNEFKSGHVGACISPTAHAELWPQVASWIKKHSQ